MRILRYRRCDFAISRLTSFYSTERSIDTQVSVLLLLSHFMEQSIDVRRVRQSRELNQQGSSRSIQIPFPRSPNSSGSSASSTKRLTASPPPKPTPKRTSKTPAPCLKATCNPSSRSAVRGGWRSHLRSLRHHDRMAHASTSKDSRQGRSILTLGNHERSATYRLTSDRSIPMTYQRIRRRATSAGKGRCALRHGELGRLGIGDRR